MMVTGAYGVPEEKVANVAVAAIAVFCSDFATPSLKHAHLVDIRPGIVRLYQKELEVQVKGGVFAQENYITWSSWLGSPSATSSPARHQTGGGGDLGTDVDQKPSWRDGSNDSHGRVSDSPSSSTEKERQEQMDRDFAQALQENEHIFNQSTSAGRGRGRGILNRDAPPVRPGSMNYAGAVATGQSARPGGDYASQGRQQNDATAVPKFEPMDTDNVGSKDSDDKSSRSLGQGSTTHSKVRTAGVADAPLSAQNDLSHSGNRTTDPKHVTNSQKNDMPGVHSHKPDQASGAASAATSKSTLAVANEKAKLKDGKKDDAEQCSICMDTPTNPVVLSKCKHVFCKTCIDQCFEKMQPKCPNCGVAYGVLTGAQPDNGTMAFHKERKSLAGYESYGTLVITYSFPDGVQTVNQRQCFIACLNAE